MTSGNVNIVSIKVLEHIDYKEMALIDIRDRAQFLKGHIPNAINKKDIDLYNQIEWLKKYKKVYIYCDYGNKGMRVTKILQNNYLLDHVYNIVGGYSVYRGRIEY